MRKAIPIVLLLMLMSSACLMLAESGPSDAADASKIVIPQNGEADVGELEDGSYCVGEVLSGTSLRIYLETPDGEITYAYVDSGDKFTLPYIGEDNYFVIKNMGQTSAEVSLEVVHPNGSPVLYAAICIAITAFIGFLIYWNGRTTKID